MTTSTEFPRLSDESQRLYERASALPPTPPEFSSVGFAEFCEVQRALIAQGSWPSKPAQ